MELMLLCIEAVQISFISCSHFMLAIVILFLKLLIVFIVSVFFFIRNDFDFWY
jgi:hypothetical protein